MNSFSRVHVEGEHGIGIFVASMTRKHLMIYSGLHIYLLIANFPF